MNQNDSKIHVVCKESTCDALAYREIERQTSLAVVKMRADSKVSIPRRDVIIVFDDPAAVARLHEQYPLNCIIAIIRDDRHFGVVRPNANMVFGFEESIRSRFKWQEKTVNRSKVTFS